MNICLTTNHSPWSAYTGGGPNVVHNLAKQLSSMGHKVFVVYTVPEKVSPSSDVNYEIIWAKSYAGQRQRLRGLNVFTVARAVDRLSKKVRLDIIHGAGDEAALLPLVARRNKSIFVMTIHRPLYPKLNSTRLLWRPDIIAREHLCFFEWYAYSRASRIFAVSNYIKGHVMANLGLKAAQIETVYNGISNEFFDVARKNDFSSGKKLLIFGRLEPQKGVDILLKAFATALPKLDKEKVTLTVSGRGDYQKEYQDLAASLGISDRVVFTDWASREQLKQLMSDAYLCVLPSRVESFGLTIGESMAAGVPTISTNTSSIPEIITDGENGYLVPPEDPEALAEKMLYALYHPEEVDKIGKAGRERIKQNFTWEKVAARYCAAYESLLEKKK